MTFRRLGITDEDIGALRAWYLAELGIPDNGYALPVNAAVALIAKLEALDAKVIVDAGAGFSTVLLRIWAKDRAVVRTLDHDDRWLDRVSQLLQKLGLSSSFLPVLHPAAVEELPEADVILIDHGPTMADRLAYLPRFTKRLATGGVLALDDWRKAYRRQAAAVLAGLGFLPEPMLGTRLCFARRTLS